MKNYRTFIVIALSGLISLSSCSFGGEKSPRPIPTSQQKPILDASSANISEKGVGRIYLGKTDSTGGTLLTGVQRDFPNDPKAIVKVLLQGATTTEEGLGLRTAIPRTTVVIAARYLASDLVKVDISADIFQSTGDDLILAVAQIVLTLCDIIGVERVILTVDGEFQQWPKGDGSLTTDPLRIYDYPGRIVNSESAYPVIISSS